METNSKTAKQLTCFNLINNEDYYHVLNPLTGFYYKPIKKPAGVQIDNLIILNNPPGVNCKSSREMLQFNTSENAIFNSVIYLYAQACWGSNDSSLGTYKNQLLRGMSEILNCFIRCVTGNSFYSQFYPSTQPP